MLGLACTDWSTIVKHSTAYYITRSIVRLTVMGTIVLALFIVSGI